MTYTVLVHPSGNFALISHVVDDDNWCIIAFARENGDWTKGGITWFGRGPAACERDRISAEAKSALLRKLQPAEPAHN